MTKLAIIVDWVLIGLFVASAILLAAMGKTPNIWVIALALIPYAIGLGGLHRKTTVFWKTIVIALSVLFCLVIVLFGDAGQKALVSRSRYLYMMMFLIPVLLNVSALILQIASIKFRKKTLSA